MLSFLKKVRRASQPRCAVLVAAAGSSRRMGGVNKLMEPLDGVPVLVRTLSALQVAQRVDEIIVAAREEDLVEISRLCRDYGITKCAKVVRGGESRVHSVLLAALEASPETELLAVHDGARPLVTPELVDSVIAAAVRCGAAAPAVPVKDTVKTADQEGRVGETVPREHLRAVQTPQVFDADLLRAALKAALEANAEVTDDASAVERLGKAVFLVEGNEENLKITTPLDLILAEAITRARKERG
ncbi:MAG: 2-C-methyl-D-erythritol 4-phosphate cytidylyltransferase [Oscillibacter sp.]|nr:2-C-methyl-D-erythritol 4-phosphate cytidylyltransferase [Oscillibacter sp.]